MLYYVILYYIMLYYILLCYVMLCYIVLYCIILYYVILCYVILYYIIYILYTHVLCLTPQTELTTVKKQLFTIFRHLGSIRECQVELKVGSNGFAKALRSCSKVDIVAAFMFLNHLHTHTSLYIYVYDMYICIYIYVYNMYICGCAFRPLTAKNQWKWFPKSSPSLCIRESLQNICCVFSHKAVKPGLWWIMDNANLSMPYDLWTQS